jgi:UPF0176 protein
MITTDPKNPYQILLYYKYTHVADPEAFVKWHKQICEQLGFKGRILIAHEGINGTLEGLKGHTEEYVRLIHAMTGKVANEATAATADAVEVSGEAELSGGAEALAEADFGDFSEVQFKTSPGTADGSAFPKMKVKVRKEVVSLGLDRYGEEDIDPNKVTGIHLAPSDLKKWYESGEDFEIIDMRNDYEFKVGHFKNSINPEMDNFRDLPKILSESEKLQHIKKASAEGKKVVTVCTGGIRCEKASGYLIKKGFENVYQLDGGMHKFMEQFPGEGFLGSLYVFDNRETTDFSTDKGIERPVVGKCDICQNTTEKYTNCANIECHMKMLCCNSCLGDSVVEIKGLIAEDREMGTPESVARTAALEKILNVAGGFVFCSDECKDLVKMKSFAGKISQEVSI